MTAMRVSTVLMLGALRVLTSTATVSRSNSCAARATMSRWPSVMGSNVPG